MHKNMVVFVLMKHENLLPLQKCTEKTTVADYESFDSAIP